MIADPADIQHWLDELVERPTSARARFSTGTHAADAALRALGDAVERLAVGDVGRAMSAGEALVLLADEFGSPASRARSRRALAQSLAYAGRFPEALAACDEAVAAATVAGEPLEAARARLASLHPLANLGRFAEALAAGEAAHAAFSAEGTDDLAARADLNLGAVLAMRDEPERALGHFDRARPALLDQPEVIAQLDANRGNALTSLNRFADAEAAFAAAVAAFETAGRRLAAGVAEGNRAHLATRQGRLQAAMERFARAESLLERDESAAHLTRLLGERAEALELLGLHGDAAEAIAEVLPDLERLGLVVEAAGARATLGTALLSLGRQGDARSALERAATDLDGLDRRTDRARVDLQLAQLATRNGDEATAERLLERAVADFTGRPLDLARAHALAAALALETGDLDRAEGALAVARTESARLSLSPVLADWHLAWGRLQRARGRPSTSSFAAAVAETERIRGTLHAERFRSAFLADRLAPYTELIRESLAAGTAAGVAEAFLTAERSRSRSLLDLTGATFVDEAPAHAEESALADARAALNWHYSQLAEVGFASTPGDENLLSAEIKRLERVVDGLEAKVSTGRPAGSPTAPPIDLETTIAALPAGSAMVAFVLLDNEASAFVLRDGGCRVFRSLVTTGDLLAAARRLRLQISRGLAARAGHRTHARDLLDDARRELRTLWSLLIAPLTDAIAGAECLVIVPHGPLHGLPFSALWDGGHYLVERHEVATAPSASIWVRLQRAEVARGAPLVAGVADAAAPAIADEVRSVAASLGTDRVLEGAAATTDRIAALPAEPSVVHFACHGRFSRNHPRASGLKLADRWLTIPEIAQLPLKGSHVTLSACESGRAAIEGGDEQVGLVRSFYAAGARSVISSLWPVVDERTTDLMSDCYRQWRNGAAFPAALRAAQRTTLAQHPHPAVWAAMSYGGAS